MSIQTKDREAVAPLTRDELKVYLTEIEQRVIEGNTAYMHSLVAMNELLRRPEVPSLLDNELKTQMQDIWIKLKSTGLQLVDPPLLFGLPQGFGAVQEDQIEEDEAEELQEIAAQESKRKKELPVGPDGNLIS